MNDPGIEFTEVLYDAQDQPHTWRCLPFNPDDGLAILTTVLQCASGPMGTLLGGLKDDAGGVSLDAAGEAVSGLMDQSIDAAGLGSAIHSFVSEVQRQGGPRLVRRILSQTWRDGRAMSNDAEYSRAFRANYAEMFRAVWWVLVVNFKDALTILKRPTAPGAATPG